MISERNISEKFSTIWKQNFPLLTSNFIKSLNENHLDLVNLIPITNKEDVRYDLISEAAFNLSEIIISNKITLNDFISEEKEINDLFERTANSIWIKDSKYENLEITKNEYQDMLKISNNILEFIAKSNGEEVQFRPKLIGYSFIPNLEADISIDDTLYELKTVKRNYKSSDLKQIFIYLALKQVSNSTNWKFAGLYNPRKGTVFKFDVKELIYKLTSGLTPNEAFLNLLNGLVRDVEIDSVF